jgi:polysaccharide pyruvyl transferase WcaK-like protein
MKILFLGTHGQFNIGDELLLETFLSQLGSENQYAVNSYDPVFTQNALTPNFKVETFHTTRELPRFLKYLITSDLLFFGGGSIIKELYASVGRNPYSTLLMILATVTFAKQVARKRVVMSNIGVGPIRTSRGEQLARWILNQVDVLSVRDERSLQTTLKLGIPSKKIIRLPDAVFANPPEVFIPVIRRPSPAPGKIRIALNLNYDIENRNAWEPFLEKLTTALVQLNKVNPIEIHALPMQSKFKENDDLSVLVEFSTRIPEISFIKHDPQTAQEAAQIMADCDLILAERLHTLVIASIIGVPFYGLVYDVKVEELVEYLGMSDYCVNINQPFELKILTDGIESVLSNSKILRVHLIERSTLLRTELMKYFDELKTKIYSQ